MEDRKVSGVAFDSYWSPPSSDDTEENIVYRFGSVGQDTKLLLWDLPMDEIVVPLRRSSLGGSPTFSTGSQSSHWDSTCPVGTLQPAPSMRDVPKLSPLVAHCVHSEPLSGLVFTEEAILTASWKGMSKFGRDQANLKVNQTQNPWSVLVQRTNPSWAKVTQNCRKASHWLKVNRTTQNPARC
ncbi:Transducin/WD40 repeat-like superfamily protein [Prunus dulcis]|uniref:Transducin/WD40 repeat-like superfamily protein n=1 Tax=Prunus dulcis TaxID=3755 RepID=A0A4Y1RL16_PRUDU|nr:Transducin/WD40 repeat-like superfamily protein [Prunus dulcis]